MIHLLVIVVSSDSSYANHFLSFYEDFLKLNHATLTVLLIFESRGKIKKITCGSFKEINDFPNYQSFSGGFEVSELSIWVEEAKEFCRLRGLADQVIHYFYGDPKTNEQIAFNSVATSKQQVEFVKKLAKSESIESYCELMSNKPRKPKQVRKIGFVTKGSYVGEVNEYGKYEGYGILTLPGTVRTVEGFWSKGVLSGYGTYRIFDDIQRLTWFKDTNPIRYYDEEKDIITNSKAKIRKITLDSSEDGTKYGELIIGNINYKGAMIRVGWRRRCWRHGKGIEIVKGLGTYYGEFQNNSQTGKGTMFFENGDIYSGEYIDGKISGRGIYQAKNGESYEGEWVNNNRTGRGKLSYGEKGSYWVYEGDFLNGRWNGKGTYYTSCGEVYTGEFVDGMPHGIGTYYYLSGVYVGAFLKGCRQGYGIMIYKNGDYYFGNWEGNRKAGCGRYEFSDGRVYVGNFLEGSINGKGKMMFVDGSYYKGDFVNGKFNGVGEFFWSDGRVYRGDFKDGRRHGKGEFFWTDGTTRKGEFFNGARCS